MRLRRFRVASLEGLQSGARITLPPEEAHHAAVLRLSPGDKLELGDASGRGAICELEEAGGETAQYIVRIHSVFSAPPQRPRLYLALAWPKGKRAAWLVEKCVELGVDKIIPVKYSRSVVQKADESAGLERLRRIAAQAAKQSGRKDLPAIAPPASLEQILTQEAPAAFTVVLEPAAEAWLPDIMHKYESRVRAKPLLLLIGPEGGLTAQEHALLQVHGIPAARLARHVLRVETAALAACALARALIDCLDERETR